MKMEIKVPEAGESITSGVIASWLKENGDSVNEGDILCELETDKTTLEIPAPAGGVLKIQVEEETEVEIGQVIGIIDSEEQAAVKETPEPKEQTPQRPERTEEPPEPEPEQQPQPQQETPREKPETSAISAPAESESAETVTPDVDAFQKNVDTPQSPPQPARIRAGRAETPKRTPPQSQQSQQTQRSSERIAMSTIRKKTAQRLVQAQQTAAYLTTFNEIDMQKVIDIRAAYKDQFEREHGIKIGFMSFFVKACCQALKVFPGVNCQLDGDDLVYHHFYDIGVAISTDQGLLVPIVRDADKLHFAEIESVIADYAERARSKKIKIDELTGGTFTITNGGVFGSMLSTPIPAYPQTAILGMHAIKKRPVVVDDKIVIRPIMYVALSYDHRVIDGKKAISFLMAVKNYIEEPDKLLLEM